jgi:hypothetical protein
MGNAHSIQCCKDTQSYACISRIQLLCLVFFPMASKRFKLWINALWRLKPPEIMQCDCSWLFLAEHPCILISWHTKGAIKINVQPLHKTYRMQSGGVVLSIPSSVSRIIIIARNIWGSDRRVLPVQSVTADSAVSESLSHQVALSRSTPLSIKPTQIHVRSAFKLKLHTLAVSTPSVTINPESIKLHTHNASQN